MAETNKDLNGNIDASNMLYVENVINDICPWSGKPVVADSLTLYKNNVVGFCNPGCRDKFETAIMMFDQSLNALDNTREPKR